MGCKDAMLTVVFPAYWNGLMATLASPTPIDKMGGLETFDGFYEASRGNRGSAGQEIEQDLIVHGLSPIENYQMWHVFGIQNGEDQAEESPYQNLFNANDGVIIATYNWRPEDLQKKLQWSEIVYQTYLRNMAPGQSISRLQTVIQVDVVSPGTFLIAKQAYQSIGLDATTDEGWRKWTLADQQYFFYALLGTDNIKGTVWLLNDHPTTIGKKVITEIWTRFGNSFDIWINIGPYDLTMDTPIE